MTNRQKFIEVFGYEIAWKKSLKTWLNKEFESPTSTENVQVQDTISRKETLDGLEKLNIASFYEDNEHSKEAYKEIKSMIESLSPVSDNNEQNCNDCIRKMAVINNKQAVIARAFQEGVEMGEKNARSRWISCAERQPEDTGCYLCTYISDGLKWVQIFRYEMGKWFVPWYTDEVTAWQELDEPYEGGKND